MSLPREFDIIESSSGNRYKFTYSDTDGYYIVSNNTRNNITTYRTTECDRMVRDKYWKLINKKWSRLKERLCGISK
jgi:hypothetical protein